MRHGGHRAAAGCEILASEVEPFRAAFEAHAAATLRPEDLVPSERADAVVAGDELGLALAEELELLAPFGIANPGVSLLLPAARFSDPRTMGEGKHARFSVEAGGMRAGAVAFGVSKVDCDGPLDATFSLELNEFNGAVEPRLVLRHARPCAPAPITVVGEPEDYLGAVFDELARPLAAEAARTEEPLGRAPGGAEDSFGRAPGGGASGARRGGAEDLARAGRRGGLGLRRGRAPTAFATVAAAGSPARSARSSPPASRSSSSRPTRSCARATSDRSSAASSCARTRRSSATPRWPGRAPAASTSSCSTRPPGRRGDTASSPT